MHRLSLVAAIVALMAVSVTATPTFAGYGALARDPARTDKVGLSWDKPTPHDADAAAIKDCGDSACKIITRTKPHQCTAIATSKVAGNTAWGAGVRGTRSAAQFAAMNDCQKRTKGQCTVRVTGCNQ